MIPRPRSRPRARRSSWPRSPHRRRPADVISADQGEARFSSEQTSDATGAFRSKSEMRVDRTTADTRSSSAARACRNRRGRAASRRREHRSVPLTSLAVRAAGLALRVDAPRAFHDAGRVSRRGVAADRLEGVARLGGPPRRGDPRGRGRHVGGGPPRCLRGPAPMTPRRALCGRRSQTRVPDHRRGRRAPS